MKKELRIGLFIISAFAVFLYFVMKTNSLAGIIGDGDSYTLKGKFTTVAGVFNGTPVRLAGIKIGVVTDVSLENNQAVLTFQIKNKYKLNTNARAMISSLGIVGEKFIEIVYREEFKRNNPKPIQEGGELITVRPFDLDALSDQLNGLTTKVNRVLDSATAILEDRLAQDSVRETLVNLKEITGNINKMLKDKGDIQVTLQNVNKLTARVVDVADSLKRVSEKIEQAMKDGNKGMFADLKASAASLKNITDNVNKLLDGVNRGEGTAGKILKDDALYNKLDKSLGKVQKLLGKIEEGTESIKKSKLSYSAGADYYTDEEKARLRFGIHYTSGKGNIINASVEGQPDRSKPKYSLVMGKQYGIVGVAGGIVNSHLGAALYFKAPGTRLNFSIEASRFYRADSPYMRAIAAFSLTKNLSINAGYEDFLKEENRKFMLGITFSN